MCSAGLLPSKSAEVPIVSIEDKIGFLSTPESYSEHTAGVLVLQTHHAWLFMTDRHVYKMKKPFHVGGLDYSSLDSRHVLCLEEYRLNRRLAARTYLGVVALAVTDSGEFAMSKDGTVVEWLVKMRRLPEMRVLPALAAEGRVSNSDISRLMRKLSRFHEQASVCRFAKDAYAARLRHRLEFWQGELERCRLDLPTTFISELSCALSRYIQAWSELLEFRQLEGRIRQVHGDLRPEHVFILENTEPEIIDCLEFDADLRRLDCAEELAYFAMEARHLGLEWLGDACIEAYRREQPEIVEPAHLMAFYAALSATVRAGLMAWRALESPTVGTFSQRAQAYLEDACFYVTRAE